MPVDSSIPFGDSVLKQSSSARMTARSYDFIVSESALRVAASLWRRPVEFRREIFKKLRYELEQTREKCVIERLGMIGLGRKGNSGMRSKERMLEQDTDNKLS